MRSLRTTNGQLRQRSGSLRRAHPRRGYSLIETMVASMLAAFLGMLLALSCASFGRSALEVESRARITQEGILAAQSLACDFGGFLADAPGRMGTLAQYSFTNWDASQGNVLVVNFQGTIPTDVVAITYQLNGNQLVRSNSSSGVTTTIARYVTAFSVEPNPQDSSQVVIQITITYRYFTSTYTLIGISPT
jgi:Tfp pilus assembly protein PilW